MRFSRRRLLAALVIPAALVTSVTCSDRLTAPSPKSGHVSVAFRPEFSTKALRAVEMFRETSNPLYDSVRVVIYRTIKDTLGDTTVAFVPGQDSVHLQIKVAAAPGEQLNVALSYFVTTSNHPNFQGSTPATATVVDDPQSQAANVAVVPVNFVGPGFDATNVSVSTNISTATVPTPVFATAVVSGAGGVIQNPLLSWSTDDPTVATVDTSGIVTPTPKGGTVHVTAMTFNGLPGTSPPITFYPQPATIVPISGTGQSGEVGSTLPTPFLVEVHSAAGAVIPGQPVTFTATGTGSAAPTTLITDASGRAQTTLTLGTTPGTYTYTATSGTATGTTTATAVAAAASSLVAVSGDAQTDTVSKTLKNPLVVKVTDRFGNPKSGVTVAWVRTGFGTLSAPSTTTGTDGQTSVTYAFGTRVGTETVTASVAGITVSPTFTLTAVAAAPSGVTIVSGDGQSVPSGALASDPLVIQLADGSSNPVVGGTVVWAVASGAATLENTQTSTGNDGRATARLRGGATLGPVTITATVGAKSTTFHAVVTAGPAAKVVFVVQPSAVVAGAAIAPPVSVVVRDANDNPVTTATSVTLTLGGGTVGAALTGTTTQTSSISDGTVIFNNLSVNLAGLGYTLAVSGTGLTGATSTGFNVTAAAAGVPAALVFGVQPGNTVAAAAITPAPTVRIVDGNNNLVATANNSVTVAIAAGSGAAAGVLSGTVTVTAVNGVATFPGLSIGTPSAGYQLKATSGALTAVTSGPFTITAGGVGAVASTTVTPNPDSLFSFNQTSQLVATGRNVANAVVAGTYGWLSRDPTVVTVSAAGLVTSVANGTTYVVATEAGGTKDSSRVTVLQRIASVNVTPGARNIYLTQNFTLAAAAVDGQGNPVPGNNVFTWTSVTPSVATVSAAGLVTGVTLGAAQIRATTGGITGVANISIITPITRIEVGRDQAGVPVADATPLTALGIGRGYDAIAHDTLDAPMAGVTFTWVSTNGSVAILDTVGPTHVHALAAANGITAITATAQGVSGNAALTVAQVLAGVSITPPTASVAPSGTVELVARGTDSNNRFISGGVFTFASSAPGFATVNANGVVTGVAVGNTNITATSGAIVSPPAFITVSNVVPPIISFGRDTLSVGRAATASIPLFLSRPNPTPVTVNLAVKDTNAFFSSATVVIPANTTSINVNLTGRNAGTTSVYATDGGGSGYAGDTAVVAVTARLQFAQGGWSINNGDQVATQVLLSDPSPAGGTFVTFTYATAGRAQVSPDPAFIPAGQLAADVIITGLTAGNTTITPVATGVNGTASTINISVAKLQLSSLNILLGTGQNDPNQYVYTPNTTNTAIPVAITTSDNTVATVTPSITLPAGSNFSRFTVTALQPGTVRLIMSATGWAPDTMTVTVTTPALQIFGGGTLNTTSPLSNVTIYAEDSISRSPHNRTNSLVVRVASSDTTVMVVLDTVATIPAGQYYTQAVRVRPGGNGGQAWVKVSAAGHVSDSTSYTVVGPQLNFAYNINFIGAGQTDVNRQYVYAPNNVAQPLTVTLTNTNPGASSLPLSVTIPTGSNFEYKPFVVTTPGPSTLGAAAPGYQPATTTLVVTTPQLVVCCITNLNNFAPASAVTVYAADSLGSTHVRTTPLAVTLTSLDPTIFTVDSTTVTIPANQFFNNNARGTAVGVGTGRVVATAPGHTPDTVTYTVLTPKLNFSFDSTLYGRRQQSGPTDLYVYTPDNRVTPLTVTFTQKQPGVDSLSSTTLTIPTATNFQYLNAFAHAFGRDTIIASAPGYTPDTAFIRVSTPGFIANGLPASATTTNAPASVNVFATDSLGFSAHDVSDTLVVKAVSSDSTVIRPNQPYFRIIKGTLFTTTTVAYVGPGTATLTFSDSAGTGYLPVTTTAVTVTGPSLNFSTNTLKYGMRQMSGPSDVYVYTANNVTSPLVVNLVSTDPRVITVPATVTIPTGQNFAYFTVTGKDTLGTIQVQATATGYSPAIPIAVQVTAPKFIINTANTLNTTSAPQIITLYATDAAGTVHYVTEDVVVSLTSSAPGVASIDSTFVTIRNGNYYTQAARWSPVSPGTSQLRAFDPRAVMYQYGDGTQAVQVVVPALNLGWSSTPLGLGQYIAEYVSTPDNQTVPLTVALTHIGTARTSVPNSVTIPAGSNFVAFNVVGTASGTDSLIATVTSGTPQNPDTAYTAVDVGRVDPLSNWPTTIATGDSVQITLFSRDPGDNVRNESAATTFTLAPNANIQFKAGGAAAASTVITSAVIPADGFFTSFWVKGVSAGTGSVTITSPNYTSYTITVTVTPPTS